ncbi:dihydroxyacetone kinase subunit DhaL [Actinobacillus pleuropneumoniae]|uniref:PTS-dependent dihydroxyacetone kinase, ADP-binding subunit DhaL n=2 Tax=Actinobacillus pleuropneumoniae TaxID=715 RepID=B3GZS2_ACTP7|nr:dihydroxyacetone kinase subunit DhaL [Actinobacillus pleuropneumoniae]ACE60734.1 PTS-dependent dihydroxyacetone kinase, ADP- binding subunit DhaL [Actinobacillus pleuropneumoniae serovar 7 str. AP76]ASU16002.1 PEP-dependent dihydroxyacetone kinase, ADP-binding subunit DhaL [Actinobacillus pleuropneumoniae]AWG94501.1 dihydroxyacetone kinase subunit L [Actinobacillus pleuropneumoniae serovar 1 str. 4074]AXA20574.1 dihydroxyacetone kinase subunit L [Actinobacillus pleuropneumoniae]EFM95139.1 P
MAISKQQILQWLENCNQVMTEQRDFLTQLDTEIGDGDHGLNMQRGFSKALEKIATVSDKDIGTILKTVGMTLLSQVGGASGPLYGTLFIKGSQVANGKEQLTFEELVSIFKAGVEGIIARGRAEPGDKTLCDVWLPLLDELAQADHSQPEAVLLNQAVEKAENFAKATVPMTAKKGRASYLGERSVGHADPGATSSYYLIKALADAVK